MQPDMIITWADVLSGRYAGGHRVYVMYDGDDTCLYVGKSGETRTRLLSHVGLGTFNIAAIGQWVIEHRPQSHDWKIALYLPAMPELSICTTARDVDRHEWAVNNLESDLIYDLSPVFNAQGKKSDISKVRAFWNRQPQVFANAGMVRR